MPSLIPGYEYDIFISYRHKDNKGDRWVTEFVTALKTELEGTLKEDISIYFDENPHDGLLETHHVDKSLEGKLKCLIFIPIISQTYCDTKSFAWEHEFCAFNNLAKEDLFGRDIKLNNGNVASRILPIKIHDLDAEDKSTIESEIGGVLRSIEFIFKSTGVNRPLRALEDHPQDNLNKTYYRDQINKVANAVKEIINSFKSPNIQNSNSTGKYKASPSKKKRKALLASIGLVVLLSIIGYVFYPKLASSETILDRSIAVLPFVDMSPDKDQEYLGDGIADDIINTLSRIKELKVIGRTSSFQFKGEKIDLRDVGEKLNVSKILEGSVIKSGSKIRITVLLINVSDGAQIWSERYEKEMDNIFDIQDQISRAISERLKISLLGNKSVKKTTSNPEAFENYLRGNQIVRSLRGDEANPFFKKAIELDSMYADAYTGLAWSYFFSSTISSEERFQKMTRLAQKVEELDPESGNSHALLYHIYSFTNKWGLANEEYQKYLTLDQTPLIQHALDIADIEGDFKGGIEELRNRLTYDPIDDDVLRLLGRLYAQDKQFVKANEMISKAIEIDPYVARYYRTFSLINILEGNYNDALDNLEKAIELDSNIYVSGNRIWALTKLGRIDDAKKIIASQEFGPLDNAKFNFWLGNLDEGFRLLEQALVENDIELMKIRTNPQFDVVREDSRFKEFIKKVDFPEID